VHGIGGVLDGHPPGFHLFLGGPAQGQAGGQQPAGGEGGVEFAALLRAADQFEHPAEDRGVAAGVLFGADSGKVPDERVTGGHLPPGLQQPDQCHRGRQVFQPGSVEGRGHLRGGLLDDRVEQRLAGGEVGVDGLPADPGGAGDVFDAGTGVGVQGLGGGLQDRGDALPGVGPLPPAPGLRLR